MTVRPRSGAVLASQGSCSIGDAGKKLLRLSVGAKGHVMYPFRTSLLPSESPREGEGLHLPSESSANQQRPDQDSNLGPSP
jgi:hypothetical protein